MLPPAISLMTPTCGSTSLSRARSVPLPASAEEEASPTSEKLSRSSPPSQEASTASEAKATGSLPTTHYTVVATDCRRSALLMSSQTHLNSRRGSSSAPASSSFGSFGGNDADHEDNIDDDDVKQPIPTVEGN